MLLIVNHTQYGRGKSSSCDAPVSLAGSPELRPRILLCPHYLNAQPAGVVESHRIDVVDSVILHSERAPFLAVLAKGVSEYGTDSRDVLFVAR